MWNKRKRCELKCFSVFEFQRLRRSSFSAFHVDRKCLLNFSFYSFFFDAGLHLVSLTTSDFSCSLALSFEGRKEFLLNIIQLTMIHSFVCFIPFHISLHFVVLFQSLQLTRQPHFNIISTFSPIQR